MSLTSKIKTLLWYLRHPSYYRSLIQLIRLKLLGSKKENSRSEAESWCKMQFTTTESALKTIFGESYKHEDFNVTFSPLLKSAKKRADTSPVKMGGPGNMNLLYSLAEGTQAKKILETGVAYGWSSLALLQSLSNRDGHLISTDMPYAKMGNEDYVGCVVPENLKKKWTLIRKPDIDGLPEAFHEMPSFDLCHYDSDKSYQGRMWAYPKLWERLRDRGVFVSDDIGDNLAFKDFSVAINQDPIIIKFHQQYVGILIKK